MKEIKIVRVSVNPTSPYNFTRGEEDLTELVNGGWEIVSSSGFGTNTAIVILQREK